MRRMMAECLVSSTEAETAVRAALADRRLTKISAQVTPGDLTSAVERFSTLPSPPLLIIETTARDADETLTRVDALADVCRAGTQLIVVGGPNDVGLYRQLVRRGVADHVPLPIDVAELAQALVDAAEGPAAAGKGKAVAFIAAKGGAGSSTIAQSLAWSLSRAPDRDVMLFDLDLPFGADDIGLNLDSTSGAREALAEPERLDAAALDRYATRFDERLRLLAAPAGLDVGHGMDVDRLEATIDAIKAHYNVVALDLPRVWQGATQGALRLADEVVVTTTCDLAALRATRDLLDWLGRERAGAPAPLLALNMVGGDRKPVIEAADFIQALGVTPTVIIPGDADAFRLAAASGEMPVKVKPKSPAVVAIDQLHRALVNRIDPRHAALARPTPLLKRLFGLGAKA